MLHAAVKTPKRPPEGGQALKSALIVVVVAVFAVACSAQAPALVTPTAVVPTATVAPTPATPSPTASATASPSPAPFQVYAGVANTDATTGLLLPSAHGTSWEGPVFRTSGILDVCWDIGTPTARAGEIVAQRAPFPSWAQAWGPPLAARGCDTVHLPGLDTYRMWVSSPTAWHLTLTIVP